MIKSYSDTLSYNINLYEILIEEYEKSFENNRKSDFYDNVSFSGKNLSSTKNNSSNFKKDYYIINLEIKYLPDKKMKKINNKKNFKKSSKKRIIKIDKKFLNEINSNKNDILEKIKKENYIKNKLIYLILIILIKSLSKKTNVNNFIAIYWL